MTIRHAYVCDNCGRDKYPERGAEDLTPVGIFIPEVLIRPDSHNRYRQSILHVFICESCSVHDDEAVSRVIRNRLTLPIGERVMDSRGSLP